MKKIIEIFIKKVLNAKLIDLNDFFDISLREDSIRIQGRYTEFMHEELIEKGFNIKTKIHTNFIHFELKQFPELLITLS